MKKTRDQERREQMLAVARRARKDMDDANAEERDAAEREAADEDKIAALKAFIAKARGEEPQDEDAPEDDEPTTLLLDEEADDWEEGKSSACPECGGVVNDGECEACGHKVEVEEEPDPERKRARAEAFAKAMRKE